MAIKAKVRSWGSSFGVIIPADIVKKEGINEGDEIIMELSKQKPLKELFGSLKGWKIDPQKAKDDARKEWSKW